MPTLLFVNVVMLSVCMAAQCVALKLVPEIPGVSLWVSGTLLGCIGCLALFGRMQGMPVAVSVLGNGVIVVGYYLVYVGLGAHVGRPPRGHKVFACLFAAFLLGMTYFATIHDSLLLRSHLVSFAMVLICGSIVFKLRAKLAEKSLVYWACAGLFTGHALFYLYRIAATMNIDARLFEHGATWAGTFTESLAFVFSASMIYLLLISVHLQEKLRRQARTDPLTGLNNRKAFYELADRVFERVRVSGTTVAILALDLDHFKRVNDTYGHLAGDAVLSAFAGAVSKALRPTDILARTGGEEFLVLLPEAGENGALVVAERLRSVTEALRIPDVGPDLRITVSIGIAVGFPREDADGGWLYREADEALYRAKALGRNRAVLSGGEGQTDRAQRAQALRV